MTWFRLALCICCSLSLAPFSFAADPPAKKEPPAKKAEPKADPNLKKQPLEDKPIAVEAVKAFSNLRPKRPIVVTNFGDGSNRIVIATQYGKIYSIPNDPNVEEEKLFMDIEDRVLYEDKENEKGFLGLAFHPKFKQNGEFFIYYTPKKTDKPHTAVVSRFKAKDGVGDPSSEEVLLTIPQPYWNHKGGTVAFGPDGMLYIGLGDGGKADDPHGNGQNLNALLGKILRIDVDHKDAGKNYAIPRDNPFVGKADAKPEIWALGIRNIWRMSFDRETGVHWTGEVGQNLWEEIDIIVKGGNYGWNYRESMHPFPPNADHPPKPEMIEPIWEYHHDIGKSITGGVVYRGKKVPELVGKYLYADYVTGKLWALDYDLKAKKVNANYIIPCVDQNPPVITFGEDEQGEVYFTTAFGNIYRFQSKK